MYIPTYCLLRYNEIDIVSKAFASRLSRSPVKRQKTKNHAKKKKRFYSSSLTVPRIFFFFFKRDTLRQHHTLRSTLILFWVLQSWRISAFAPISEWCEKGLRHHLKGNKVSSLSSLLTTFYEARANMGVNTSRPFSLPEKQVSWRVRPVSWALSNFCLSEI